MEPRFRAPSGRVGGSARSRVWRWPPALSDRFVIRASAAAGDGDRWLLRSNQYEWNRTPHYLVGATLPARLRARHRVITLDGRGHGDSSRASTDFGHEELADDAMAVIEASGVRGVVPVAQAHGGWAAVELRRRLEAGRAGVGSSGAV